MTTATNQPTTCYLLTKRQRRLVMDALNHALNTSQELTGIRLEMVAARSDIRTAPIVSEWRANAVVTALRSMPKPRGMSDYERLNNQKDALALAKEIEETYLTPINNDGNGERDACI